MSESKIETLNIELNPELKERGSLKFTNLRPIFESDEQKGAVMFKIKKVIYYCSSDLDENKFISGLDKRPIIYGYYRAYVNHMPVSISPDILWTLIVQGFCRHIDQNAEKLRQKFVQFEGKKELVVDGNEWTIESITKEGWEYTFQEFVEKIKEQVGEDIINILTPNFSTTTPIIQVSSQIAIMSAFKNYFNYKRLYGGCGFPYIELQGTLDDYLQLKAKIEKLKGYDIDHWLKELIIIVDKIIDTKKGKIDKEFWNNFIVNKDLEEESSGLLTKIDAVDGWLLNFYPYLQDYSFSSNCTKYVLRDSFNTPFKERDLKDFPEDFIEVPLIMHHKIFNTDTELCVKTGFLGMVREDNGIIRPEIGYYIANKIFSEENIKNYKEKNKKK